MALNYRRGSAAIQDAATSKRGGGQFRPFLPEIFWKNDGDSKFVLVLSDIDAVAELLLHSFIPVGKGTKANGDEFIRYEDFLSRKDPALNEGYDDLEDRLEREPKTRCMGVMVELEPILEAGTRKFKSFVVKTETFTRKTDDGEVEVTAPVIGLCTQSAFLMWTRIEALHGSVGDLTAVPLQITRRGQKAKTQYDFLPFLEKPVDLSPVIDYLDGISYIGDDIETVLRAVEAAEGETAQAQAVADYLLNKRIEELADRERYEELVGPLTLEDMPKEAWGRKQSDKPAAARPDRPARRSPREAVSEEPTPVVEPAPSKNEKFAALKSRVEARG